MVRIAAKEDKKVFDPVRYPKAQHAAVEICHRLRVLNHTGDMAELKRPGSQCLMVGAQIVPLREQLNRSAHGIAESQHLADTRDSIAEPVAFHAILRQVLGNVAEVGMRRDLKRNSPQLRRVAAFKSNAEKPGFARQKCLASALGIEHQPIDFGVVGNRSVEVRCVEGGVSDAACLDHDFLQLRQILLAEIKTDVRSGFYGAQVHKDSSLYLRALPEDHWLGQSYHSPRPHVGRMRAWRGLHAQQTCLPSWLHLISRLMRAPDRAASVLPNVRDEVFVLAPMATTCAG